MVISIAIFNYQRVRMKLWTSHESSATKQWGVNQAIKMGQSRTACRVVKMTRPSNKRKATARNRRWGAQLYREIESVPKDRGNCLSSERISLDLLTKADVGMCQHDQQPKPWMVFQTLEYSPRILHS